MSNSSLVTYVWTGDKSNSNARTHSIDRITIHHMAGNGTLKGCFETLISRGGSVNYDIDTPGGIGVMIDEDRRAWTSNSIPNDMRAVTIEVANDQPSDAGGWHVSDKALASLIKLCVDICKRRGKTKLLWLGTKDKTLAYAQKSNEMIITIHKWFAATGCPGAYLESKMSFIAAEVTRQLGSASNRVAATHGCYTYGSDSKGNPAVAGPYKKGDQWTIEKTISYAGTTWGKIKSSDRWVRMEDVTKI